MKTNEYAGRWPVQRKLKMAYNKTKMVNLDAICSYDENTGTLSLVYSDNSEICSKLIEALVDPHMASVTAARVLLHELGFEMGNESMQVQHFMIEMDDVDVESVYGGDPSRSNMDEVLARREKFWDMVRDKDHWKRTAVHGLYMYKYDVVIGEQEFTKIIFHWETQAARVFGPHDETSLVSEFDDVVKNTLRLGDVHRTHILGIPVKHFDQMREGLQLEVDCYNGGYSKMAGRPQAQFHFTHYSQTVSRAGAPASLHLVPISIVFEE